MIDKMMPIAPLMIEHRLIERMVSKIQLLGLKIEAERKVDTCLLEKIIDFIRIYADKCHHGKEEQILFRDLLKKDISLEHKKIVKELLADHVRGREIASSLDQARKEFISGNKTALVKIEQCLKDIGTLYPAHIEKEDRYFFLPAMKYFSPEEQKEMLMEFWEFDRNVIHYKYKELVESLDF